MVVTHMTHEALIAAAVAYMEAHLREPFTLRKAAQAAGYSPFHFHRLFLAVTGETPAAFIRRRRLQESARELADPAKRTLDVALAYQYDSQEAFIRAFRRHFGVTPGQYRRFERAGRAGTPSPLPAPGGSTMEPRIVPMDAFNLVGMIYFGENKNGEIPQLWTDFGSRIGRIGHRSSASAYGFCFMDDAASPNFWYMAAVPVGELRDIPGEMVAKTVPASTFAVFTHNGPISALGETYAYAYKTWLPASGFELAGAFDLEHYPPEYSRENPVLEIYIPVRAKQ